MNSKYIAAPFIQYKKEKLAAGDVLSTSKINTLAHCDKKLYAGTDEGLFSVKDGENASSRVHAKELDGKITALTSAGAKCLLIGCENRFYKLSGSKLTKVREFDDSIAGIAYDGRLLWIMTDTKLVCTDIDNTKDTVNRWLEGGRGLSLAAANGEVYCSTELFVSSIHGKRREWRNIVPGFSAMPDTAVYGMAFDGNGYVWMGTQNGVAVYDTNNLWLTSDKIRTLPQNPVYCVCARTDGSFLFGSDVGVILRDKGNTKYFAADRWVPCNRINAVASNEDNTVIYAGTDSGLAIISTYTTTLSEKAQAFDDIIEKYHIRRGFTATRHISNYDIDNGTVDISDNDGLWTASYVAAESLRYGATKDAEALKKARRGMNALLLLENISGIPGFTARAVRYPDDDEYGDGDREWRKVEGEDCEWKGETSSDEITGHFFGMSLYFDLCADKKEKKEIAESLCRITDHIVSHGFRLVDYDNLPTTWAVWDPDMLNLDDKWYAERGVNSLEFLTILKVSHHVSGQQKYADLYNKFITKYHYPLNAMQHKIQDAHDIHIDDNLGFLAMFTLLRLEENPALKAVYFNGLEDHWTYEKIERQPMFAFMHTALTGRDTDIGEAVQTLREMPLDLIHYAMHNSARKGLVYDEQRNPVYQEPQVKYPLPYDERNLHRPDGGCFDIDGENHNHCAEGTIYLLPYWLGRFYGILGED